MFRVFIVSVMPHTNIRMYQRKHGHGYRHTATYIRIQFQPILSHSSSMPWLSHTQTKIYKQARNHTKHCVSAGGSARVCARKSRKVVSRSGTIQTRNTERIRNTHFRRLLRFRSFSIPIEIRWWTNDARDKKRHNDGLRKKAEREERTLCSVYMQSADIHTQTHDKSDASTWYF